MEIDQEQTEKNTRDREDWLLIRQILQDRKKVLQTSLQLYLKKSRAGRWAGHLLPTWTYSVDKFLLQLEVA